MARLPETREMIRTLVGTPSISSTDPEIDQSNHGVVQALAGWAEGAGFEVEVLPVPGVPGKHNLLASLGPRGEGGPAGLVLSGHTDTVPCDPARWRTDPFEATELEGRIYGLGTADMKSFLALALEAASAFDPADLGSPLVLIGTADEECTMSGARALRDAGRAPGRRVIIGEPTDLCPVVAHKGILMRAIHVLGRSGHSSDPSLGANAIEGMHRVLGALLAYREELGRAHRDERFGVPVPTLNPGRIRGGDAPNRICAHCVLEIDLRPLPGMDLLELGAAMQSRVAAALEGTELGHRVEALFEGVPPFEAPPDSELARLAEGWTGREARAVAFGTEAPFFAELGMETVILGPGSIDVAHQPDEYLPVESMPATVALLREAITRFCVQPGVAP